MISLLLIAFFCDYGRRYWQHNWLLFIGSALIEGNCAGYVGKRIFQSLARKFRTHYRAKQPAKSETSRKP
ncbi:hypothetical protein [Lentilactobacillus fungorum]|uniref:hypothetical protein n=1 Tax=Lentilactobacillus fungorum TaxID=2201250 RepID=UPI0019428858|nr:hypothetical protein [Lentilactobacillus fungorum]